MLQVKSGIKMSYRREVENLLGKECLTSLLNHVRGGKMSDQQLKDFVLHLGELTKTDPKAPNILYGKHTLRMSRDRGRGQDTELLQVMCDWWENSLFEMTQDAGIKALIKALSHPDVHCNALASELSTIQNQVVLPTSNINTDKQIFFKGVSFKKPSGSPCTGSN